jgi:putative transposase
MFGVTIINNNNYIMSAYTQILYQLVFSTKRRENTLTSEHQELLYRYIWGILKKQKCYLYRINGTENHIHIITDIHPTVALSSLIKNIKLASSSFIKKENIFPEFKGWQEKYGAFTYSYSEKNKLIEYVKNQKEHHRVITFEEEFVSLLKEHGVGFNEKYLF